MRSASAATLTLVAVLALPGSAHAAYAPRLDIQVDPPDRRAAATVTATVTQARGENATRTMRVRYPLAFTFNPAFTLNGCGPADEQAARCPEHSRVGRARAFNDFGAFAGPVYISSDYRLLIYLTGLGGAVTQKLEGTFVVRPDGGYEVVLDDLPNVPNTFSELVIDGGARNPQINPRDCGTYSLDAVFESHAGERVSSSVPVTIGGCPPVLDSARVKPSRMHVGSKAKLGWRLSEAAARTSVVLERLRRNGWTRAGSLSGPADPGANQLRLDGRLKGRALAPGRYRALLRVKNARGLASAQRRAYFTIVARSGERR